VTGKTRIPPAAEGVMRSDMLPRATIERPWEHRLRAIETPRNRLIARARGDAVVESELLSYWDRYHSGGWVFNRVIAIH
jgi:hypothetical protein